MFDRISISRLDGLRLHRALPGRLLIFLVAAMTFLAALTITGVYGNHLLIKRWNTGAASVVILQLLDPDKPAQNSNRDFVGNRENSIMAFLQTQSDLASFHKLSAQEINELLSPWLHGNAEDFALPLPAIFELHLKDNKTVSANLLKGLREIAPDIIIEQSDFWKQRLNSLASSLQSCAFFALLIVVSVHIVVIALTTRTGLIACRQAIEILHILGASDYYIAQRFSHRNAYLTFIGSLIGCILFCPLLLYLTHLCLPFSSNPDWQRVFDQSWYSLWFAIPTPLFALFLFLPIFNALISWLTTEFIVYCWLRRLT